MGAHAAGELASKLAVDTIPLTYRKLRDKPAPLALQSAVAEANHVIYNRGQANLDFQGMGTTTTALCLLPNGAIAAHVGDSRVYRVRGAQIEQLSFDHSLVWELTGGKLQEAKFTGGIPKNIITRSLGPNPEVEIDLEGPYPVARGDTFVLCSDGMSGQVEDAEIGKIVCSLPPAEAAQVLVDLANLRGGPDNITVVVVRALGSLVNGAEPPVAEPKRGIHVAAWVVLFVALVVALGLLVVDWKYSAGLAGGGVVVALLLHAILSGARASQAAPASRLGRGPYGGFQCTPDRAFWEKLSETLLQLRKAATEEDWTVDWSRVDQLDRASVAAANAKDYTTATANVCRAISFMMRELEHQGTAGKGSHAQ
jgi:protein phosphatase